jgi:hypothetical protein
MARIQSAATIPPIVGHGMSWPKGLTLGKGDEPLAICLAHPGLQVLTLKFGRLQVADCQGSTFPGNLLDDRDSGWKGAWHQDRRWGPRRLFACVEIRWPAALSSAEGHPVPVKQYVKDEACCAETGSGALIQFLGQMPVPATCIPWCQDQGAGFGVMPISLPE